MPINVLNQTQTRSDVGQAVEPSGPIEDRRITREDVPDDWVEPVFEADDFVIEGPASVEIVDRTGQQIQMDAVEDALGRYMESDHEPGIISVKHDDVPVGVPLWEWSTDAGERYETAVDGDEFRLVATIGNETTQSKLARLRCLNGDYDGYSVTVYSNQEHQEPDGTRVTVDCDLHAVALGSGDILMNPAADFDVVDYKAGGALAAAIQRRLRRRRSLAGRVERTLDQRAGSWPDTFPFGSIEECAERMADDLDDPRAGCADWEREAEGKADQRLRREVLKRL